MARILPTVAFVVLFVAVMVGALLLVPWADRRRIRRMIENLGGEVLSIEPGTPSPLRFLLSERNTTFWRVRYRDGRSGEVRVAECFASCLRCKIYRDEPAKGVTRRPPVQFHPS